MIIVELTGSMGMGKSAVASRLRTLGIPVCDADAEVHKLYEGAAVPLIEAAFPGTTDASAIPARVDRGKLAAALMANPDGFKRLESIVHPLVHAAEREFLSAANASGEGLAALEIPLLFETSGDKRVDAVIVVSAPRDVQLARVLARPGMSVEKLESILSRQLSDAEKRSRADFVVDTGGTLDFTHAQVDNVLAALRGREARAFNQYWR